MEACKRHNRWIRIEGTDGKVSTRNCPECPRRPLPNEIPEIIDAERREAERELTR